MKPQATQAQQNKLINKAALSRPSSCPHDYAAADTVTCTGQACTAPTHYSALTHPFTERRVAPSSPDPARTHAPRPGRDLIVVGSGKTYTAHYGITPACCPLRLSQIGPTHRAQVAQPQDALAVRDHHHSDLRLRPGPEALKHPAPARAWRRRWCWADVHARLCGCACAAVRCVCGGCTCAAVQAGIVKRQFPRDPHPGNT